MLYTATKDIINLLSDEQAGRLMKAIFCYESGEPLPDMDGMTLVAFTSVKGYLDKDGEKYDLISQKRKEAGAKGGRKKREEEQAIANDEKAKKANASFASICNGVSDSVFDSVSVSVSVSESEFDSVSVSESEFDSESESEYRKDTSVGKPTPPARKPKATKQTYGQYGNVKLTDKERDTLFEEFGEDKTHRAITYLDEYIEEKGYKSKSHYLAIRRWVIKAVQGDKKQSTATGYDWDAL